MNSNIRLGIIGSGRIANRFVAECSFIAGIKVIGVYNPRGKSAEGFYKKHNLKFFTSKEEELFKKVDAVYIASPHATHYNYIKNALLNNKHVLCEKPMVLKKSEAEELYDLAENKKLVLMEGIKTAYCPGFNKVISLAKSGKIGEVKDVEACFTKLTDSGLREMQDIETGGSFSELGSYTVLAIIKILGMDYKNIRFDSIYSSNSIDIYTKAYFNYDKSFATSKTGLGVKSEGELLISGTKGYIKVSAPWWKTSEFEVCYEDISQNEKYKEEFLGDGLRYEISEFVNYVEKFGEFKSKLSREESIEISNAIEQFFQNKNNNTYIGE